MYIPLAVRGLITRPHASTDVQYINKMRAVQVIMLDKTGQTGTIPSQLPIATYSILTYAVYHGKDKNYIQSQLATLLGMHWEKYAPKDVSQMLRSVKIEMGNAMRNGKAKNVEISMGCQYLIVVSHYCLMHSAYLHF